MRLAERFWSTVTYVMSFLTFSPISSPGDIAQYPLGIFPDHGGIGSSSSSGGGGGVDLPEVEVVDHPRFRPPTGKPDDDFQCDYAQMEGWQSCSTPGNRECWLRHPDGREYNIMSNYEIDAPKGIDRYYNLDVVDSWLNADGINSTEAKLFNNEYPGPWIQACWGDTIYINVTNHMKHNGTSIHWHGVRQHNTMQMDGVNGVTQCPIAPGDYFVYTLNTTQYGSSWYHSHYSPQYADGLQGPITIHGPSSASYDEPKDPLILTDWGHNSAFEAVYTGLKAPSILLNGIGNVTRFNNSVAAELPVLKPYELDFEQKPNEHPKKYLLRIINTSFDTTFIFSIDNHWLQMVSADFVPIEPYFNTSLLIGIGQRYNVIVEARPEAGTENPIPEDNNFWIRTWTADNCEVDNGDPGYEMSGILRYDPDSDAEPQSLPWPDIALRCSDEAASSLVPKLPWFVGESANDDDNAENGEGERFRVHLDLQGGTPVFPLAKFAFDMRESSAFTPLQINYSDPIFLHLDDFSGDWPKSWAVVPENYSDDDWVYLVLTGNNASTTFGAHPIHLHGHDFAILQQAENQTYSPDKLDLNLNNPPRRDVVLLPTNGFIVIAFKADNPGNWLLHCHIAFHASEGLAFQILERQADANARWPKPDSPAIVEAERVCANWDAWHADCRNWWPGLDEATNSYPACEAADPPRIFQDDSGI